MGTKTGENFEVEITLDGQAFYVTGWHEFGEDGDYFTPGSPDHANIYEVYNDEDQEVTDDVLRGYGLDYVKELTENELGINKN